MDSKLYISTMLAKHMNTLTDNDDKIDVMNEITSIARLSDEMRKEVLKNKIRKLMYMEYELGSKLDTTLNIVAVREKELKNQLAILNAKKNHNGYLWVTINPDPKKANLSFFRKKIDVIAKRKCFDDYIYVLEQRATKIINIGKGYHAHLLLKRNLNYKPCKCRENLQSSCKKLMPNPKNIQTLNVQIVGEDFALDKIEYILGKKTGKKNDGKDKIIAQKLDKIWRKQEIIAQYYGKMTRISPETEKKP